jgi:hypothetical protein
MATAEALRARLGRVALRLRWLRVMRGLGWLILTLALTAGAALLADAMFELPALVRGLLLAGCLGLGAFVALLFLILPLTRRLDIDAIAAAVEEKYPDLAERLTTTIELSDTGGMHYGSPALIQQLRKETDLHTRSLDFGRAAPSWSTITVVCLAAIFLLFLIGPAAIWPRQYADLSGRFLLPWRAAPAPYSLEVTPGNTATAKGEPLTLSVVLHPQNDKAALPRSSSAILTGVDGRDHRVRMVADRPDAFSLCLEKEQVAADFRYRIEAGDVVSDFYLVTVIEPVELAAERSSATVKPPAYAREQIEDQVLPGIADVNAIQHSQVKYSSAFTKPAVAAWFEWTPFQGKKETNRVAMELTPDRTGARLDWAAVASGTYRIILEAEQGIRTELPSRQLLVKPDAAPAFLKVNAPGELKAVLPDDYIPIDIWVVDDLAITSLDLEYRINEAPPVREAIKLEGGGSREVKGVYDFQLSGKVKENDQLHYRLVATDNRNVPEVKLTPNVTYFPAEGWRSVKIAREAEPLKEQEIIAQRDGIDKRLDAIKERILSEKQGANEVRQASHDQRPLAQKSANSLRNLAHDNRNTEGALRELSVQASEILGLQSVANKAAEVAENEMHRAGDGLHAAANENKPDPRDKGLQKTDQNLDAALKELEEMKKANERAAQARLDQMKLEMLAEREKKLAEDAKAATDPAKTEQIKKEQEQVGNELKKLTEQSYALHEALEAARAEQAKQTAEKARELAQAERDLAQSVKDTEKQRNAGKLDELAGRQKELNDKAHDLAKKTQPAAESANVPPLKPQEGERAAESLEQGETSEAMNHQDKAAQELDRLANDFERAIELSRDPRENARTLAKHQRELMDRLAEKPSPDPKVAAQKRTDLQREEKAIRDAAGQFSIPPQNSAAENERKVAMDKAEKAAADLNKNDTNTARQHMDEARQALERLADRLPSLEDRDRVAKAEMAELSQQQTEVARQVGKLAKEFDKTDPDSPITRAMLSKKLTDAARRQSEIAERLSRMDAPFQEERLQKTQDASRKALADLMDARPQDLTASQEKVGRELERLEQALKGQKPADEQARDLAKQQRELARELARIANDRTSPSPEAKAELLRKQEEVAQKTRDLAAPDAPMRKEEAAEATLKADEAAKGNVPNAEKLQKVEAAARALDRLAQQMAGQESDADRAERLAITQADAAAQAERNAKQPNPAVQPEPEKQQEQIAQEAKQVRAGDEAQSEKQKAMDALAKAQQSTTPDEQAKAQREAADKLRDLADRLAGRNDDAARAAQTAREQRDLASEAVKQSLWQEVDATKKAADRQADLARRVERLDPQGAPQSRKEAAKRMDAARQQLEKAQSPAEAKDALARAIDAADKLAKELSLEQAARNQGKSAEQTSAKPNDQSPRQMAQELAKKQRDLAEQSKQVPDKTKNLPGETGRQALQKEMARIGDQQKKLSAQASQLPAAQAETSLGQAREAMNQAQYALARADTNKAQQKQREAADALDRLANQLPNEMAVPAVNEPRVEIPPAPGAPTKQQVEETRDLAKEQRDLRETVRKLNAEIAQSTDAKPGKNSVGDLAKRQHEIAKEATNLANQVGKEQGVKADSTQQAKQAAQSTQQAANQIQAGSPQRARQAGEQAAQQLKQLAQQLGDTPKPENPQGKDTAQQARELAKKQDDLNKDMAAQATNAGAQQAQQQAREQDLKNQTGQLTKDLQQIAQQSGQNPQAQQSAQQAANSGLQAQDAMLQAQNQGQRGDQGQAQKFRQDAAKALDQAAQQAQQASQQMARQAHLRSNPQTGQSLQQAQGQMQQAQDQLGEAQHQGASQSMQQAAQNLQVAAQQMNDQQGKTKEGLSNNGGSQGGAPDASLLPPDMRKYAGKRWGDLPGELRTRIIQDMRTKYGENYARMIKLYFEQIADSDR